MEDKSEQGHATSSSFWAAEQDIPAGRQDDIRSCLHHLLAAVAAAQTSCRHPLCPQAALAILPVP
eukprot:scaffold188326_cov19-Tisochrysis_lutea.AAC.4